MSKNADRTHLLVLGGGPAGYAGAFHAADRGFRVTLVDEEPNPGGVCLYRGCIPSKALLHAAKVLHEAREASLMGITFSQPQVDLDKLRSWKDDVIRNLTGGLGTLRDARKIDFIHGRGRFIDSQTVEVSCTDGSKKKVSYDVCLMCTGSRPILPGPFQIGSDRVITSDGALTVQDVPKTMLQVGGGYIGLEMAMVYQALGTKVSVVEMTGGLCPGADRDLVKPLMKDMEPRLENIYLHTKVVGLKNEKDGVTVELSGHVDQNVQKFDKVLVCVGRAPVTDGCGLENTRVKLTPEGFVHVDQQRRTSDPAIFAAGDVAGQPMLAHKASYEARIVVDVISGEPAVYSPQAIPAVMFTDPEVAWCGLTETEALEKNLPVQVLRFPWGASGRAMTLNRRQGLTKMITDPATGQILGVGIVGPGAGELLAEGAFAVEIGARAEDISMTIHAHPTLSETVMEAAEAFFGSSTHYFTKM